MKPPSAIVLPRGNGLDLQFAKFWEAYPRHEAKQPAYRAFCKVHPDEATVARMIEWIKVAVQSDQWQEKALIPFPATWLNQRRWEGDPPPVRNGRDTMDEKTRRGLETIKEWNEQ